MVGEDAWWWNEKDRGGRSKLGRTHILGSLGHRAAMLQREGSGTNSENTAVFPMASKSSWDKGARENRGDSAQSWEKSRSSGQCHKTHRWKRLPRIFAASNSK